MKFARVLAVIPVLTLAAMVAALPGDESGDPAKSPEGPFGYTLVRTADSELAPLDFFFLNEDCAVCHQRQLQEVQGSMHSAAHTDPLYRSLAEMARQEAGEKYYTYCSGCHSSAGVVAGVIPAQADDELPKEAKAGVTCDTCHQISLLTHADSAWGEPGNASFVLQPGRVKYGHSGIVAENRSHTGEKREFFSKSEFCASCHTVIHPVSGLRVEHTYGEWKSSIYAEKGIQCQDCHMRSVEDAVTVARTLKPVVVKGPSANEGALREIYPHYFVGGNANADTLANGAEHAAMAEARLKSAARIELGVPRQAVAGKPLTVDVLVHNEAAGHNLPSGVTELREMWVELRILDAAGKVLFQHGGVDDQGEIVADAIRFGAVVGDRQGKPTFKVWQMEKFLQQRTIPPKGHTQDKVTAQLSSVPQGDLHVEAKLFYRSASPHVVQAIMGDKAFQPKIVEMCRAEAIVPGH